jgi:hypothetical protein
LCGKNEITFTVETWERERLQIAFIGKLRKPHLGKGKNVQ